jgi:hypothetical protein
VRLVERLLDYPYPLRTALGKRIRRYRSSYSREHYYYCIRTAAETAAALGVGRISVLEFGVAGGNGLIEIERICAALATGSGIGFEIYGFDTGAGLPPPQDYRDLPYQWQEGFFAMDVPALRRRLKTTELVIGNVRETVPAFVAKAAHAPIGAVMFDLDYYSSTVDALGVFVSDRRENHLPRVPCYFDDIGAIPSVGVGLAVAEFNAAHPMMKVENPLVLRHRREYQDWGWKVFEMHHFGHPDYATPVVKDDQLPLV